MITILSKKGLKLIFFAISSILFGYSYSDAGPIQVAAIQYLATPYEKSRNIANLSALVEKAALAGAKLIVLPEMCTTGLTIRNRRHAKTLAESIPGPTTNIFAALARKHRIYLIMGLAESDPAVKRFYNSQIAIDPEGRIMARYRKMNLFGTDHQWADKGNLGYQTVDTPWGRLGLGICYDINFRDLFDYYAARDVRIMAFSTNWVGDGPPFSNWSEMLRGRNLYFIAANNWGREEGVRFSGGSIILSPELTVMDKTETAADTILIATIASERRMP